MSAEVGLGVAAVFIVLFGMGGCAWGYPQYNVYSQRMEGEAQLSKAESTRRTRVLEAQAIKDSAQLQADAEVIRAGGVAKANQILAESLGGPEGYLRWKYIEMLEETAKTGGHSRDTIYIPTEAGMPILEAGRRPYNAPLEKK